MEYAKVGKRGAVVIPAEMRRCHRLEEGTPVVSEDRPEGVLFRAAPRMPSWEERRRFFAAFSEAVLATQRDASAWAEELADRAQLAGTLADGLVAGHGSTADVDVDERARPGA